VICPSGKKNILANPSGFGSKMSYSEITSQRTQLLREGWGDLSPFSSGFTPIRDVMSIPHRPKLLFSLIPYTQHT